MTAGRFTRALLAAMLRRCAPALIASSLACACSVETVEPQSLRVTYRVSASDERPLRYAVLWLDAVADRVVVGQQGRVGSDGRFELRLVRPKLQFARLAPQEQLRLATQERIGPGGHPLLEEVMVPVYRPRIVVFVDENGNQRIDLSQAERRINEPVLAIDGDFGPSIALLADAKAAVALLTLENAAAFYELSPTLSDFVFVTGYGTLSQSPRSTLELVASPEDHRQVAPFCERLLPVNAESKPRVNLDSTLDRATLCGLEVSNCDPADLSEAPPDLTLESLPKQCKSNGQFAALTLQRFSYDCQGCICSSELLLDSYVIALGDAPAWWPCGREVPYCDSANVPLYAWDYRCSAVHDGDAGAQLGADAGSATNRSADSGLVVRP